MTDNSSFDYENKFYETCDNSRIAKIISHYELFKMSINVPGEIIECGVFKGSSFIRLASFRNIFSLDHSKRLIGFDTFGKFPKTTFDSDKENLKKFLLEAGENSITKKRLMEIMKKKKINQNLELVQGDINETIPQYIKKHPELKISFLNVDVDIYEPSVVILENLFPKISKNGIIVFDDYAKFAGETKAVDDYFLEKDFEIQQIAYSKSACYIKK